MVGSSAQNVEDVSITTVPSFSTLTTQPSFTTISNYGIKPAIILISNEDTSYAVASHLPSVSKIQIHRFNSTGSFIDRIEPQPLSGAQSLLGFARIPSDGSYAIAYSKASSINGKGFEYWITRVSSSGAQIFSTRLFGDISKDILNSKGEPGTASTGRLVYNPTTEKLAFYTGHSMLWDDGVRHQGGYIGFMTLTGSFVVTDGWYFSHNFDQRILVDGANYYTLAHGDAYPRALGFGKWEDSGTKGKRLFSKNYFPINGAVGENKTSTQTGGFVKLPNGDFGIVFVTGINRNNFDVCYTTVKPTGDTLSKVWITQYPSETMAIFPRIANFGENVLILWEEVVSRNVAGAKSIVLKPDGTPVSNKTSLKNSTVRLSPYYDLCTLPNGDILWANSKGSDSISVFKIRAPTASVKNSARTHNSPELLLKSAPGWVSISVLNSNTFALRKYGLNGKLMSESIRFLNAGYHMEKVNENQPHILEISDGVRSSKVVVPLNK